MGNSGLIAAPMESASETSSDLTCAIMHKRYRYITLYAYGLTKLLSYLYRLLWTRPLETLRNNGNRIAAVCCPDHTFDRAMKNVSFCMYLAFLLALVVYLPNRYPGWLTWVLFIPEWLKTGTSVFLSPLAILFTFHIIPYTVVSLALGFLSVVPGCTFLLKDPAGEQIRALGISRKEALQSFINILVTLVARYFFILMILGAVLRFAIISLQLSVEYAELIDYGMNPYLGMAADIVCLGLMIYGKIFSSVYCSMKFPNIVPAFLLSIWMTIEYWILYTVVYLVASRLVIPRVFEGNLDLVNMNMVLYSSWVVTGIIGTTVAYWMIKSSVYERFGKLKAFGTA